MSNNELDKLDHTLAAINEIGSKTDDLLEKRRSEQTVAAGGAMAARELKELHEKFMTKSRETLTEDVKAGKVPEAVGNYVMSWLRQSSEVLKKFVTDKTAQMNAKSGEVTAMESSVKLLKVYYDSYSLKKVQEQNMIKAAEDEKKRLKELEAMQAPSLVETPVVVEPQVSPKRTKKSRTRPDEVGPLAKTVKRIKENRKSRDKN